MPCGTSRSKKRQISELISNQDILNLRLSQDEKIFYTELFYDNSTNGKVSLNNFYPLLGALGTQISREFSDRLFAVFSTNKNDITVFEYLKYIDTYHYGDDRERCLLTCKLMNPEGEGKKVNLEQFTNYIRLIMNAVKKVTYNSNQELMSQSDINDLFYHISKQQPFFTCKDFEEAYRDKPELISWFDYFKNNKSDVLMSINNSIPRLLDLVNKFLESFMVDLIDILDNKKKINVKSIIENVMEYSRNLENERKKFLKTISKFNIRSTLEQSNNFENDTQQIIKTLENKIFRSMSFVKNRTFNEEEEKNKYDNIEDINLPKTINKFNSILSSNTKNERLINEEIINTNQDDSVKKQILNSNKENDIDDNKSQTYYNNNNESKYITPNNYKGSNDKSNENPSLKRAQTKKVLKFFSGIKEELKTQKTILKDENSKIEEIEDENEIFDNLDKNFIQNDNNKSPKIKAFQIEQSDSEKKRNPFEDEKEEDIKEGEGEGEDNITNENNNMNNINNINNFNFNKFSNNNFFKSNSNSNTNNTCMKPTNHKTVNIDKIKLDFDLKGTYKTEDGNTIYNDSDVESQFTLLEDKMLKDDNILFSNDNNNNILIKESINKNFSSLKQLLLCSRTVINNAHDIIQTFSTCYRWISENYLKEHIKKKMDEERKEKKRKEQKEYDTRNNVARKKKEVKKKIIRTPDESFKILLNMIMGIQISVQSCPNFKINKEADISNYLNNMIHSIQSINFGKKQEEIFFLNEFAGIIFNNIRLIFGIDKESFISSISPQEFVTEIMISSQTIFEELCSTGKSGSLFYYTRDGRFIVKTISKKEYKFLKKILTKYYSHLKDNPLSLLPKFLGCYKLIRKVKKSKYNIYFIVMMNVFATANHIDKRYDLKGSKIGRQVLKGTIEDKKILNQGDLALKDLDFENRKEKVFIGKKKNMIIPILEKDADFLEDIGSNDYSLLLGIHNYQNKPRISSPLPFQKSHTVNFKNPGFGYDRRNSAFRKCSMDKNSEMSYEEMKIRKLYNDIYDFEDGGIMSPTGDKVYYIGIIDILTEYNFFKKTEHFCKMIRYCSEKMSCIPPQKYRDRFIDYMTNVVFDNTEENFLLNNNLCASQNLNNVMNKISKDKKFNEDNKSENSYKMYDDKYKATNKNSNLNIISEEQRFNFLNNMANIKSNIDTREINDK